MKLNFDEERDVFALDGYLQNEEANIKTTQAIIQS